MMKQRIPWNYGWFYQKTFDKEMLQQSITNDMEKVDLPHTNQILPYHYFDESLYQFVSCYKKVLHLNQSITNRRIFLTFDGVAHIASVYANGKFVGKHEGGYTGFSVELTDACKGEDTVVITVVVDSREEKSLPPFGNVVDYLTYGGIYREVWLEIRDQEYIEDVRVKTSTNEDHSALLSVDVTWSAEIDSNHNWTVQLFLKKEKEKDYRAIGKYDMSAKISNYSATISNIEAWDIENPVLYHLKVVVMEQKDFEYGGSDETIVRFGFRTAEFRKDGFYLNEKKVKIVGLNRHQSYPYVGYAMPKRMQQLDAEILKNELGVNAVRTSHYPQSQHFLNRCDELGLLVFTEMPGWQHIGEEVWQEHALDNIREMILQNRNHPCIILWGVRINESPDLDSFYKRTNALAKELDDTRQTGGVRCIKKSHLFEDVYTYNDFSHNGTTKGLDDKKHVTSKTNAPYLVSECNGHMYPTKIFDHEEKRLEHAKRHMAVLESLYKEEDITGMFSWCMFDYNTHKDFGSGDRICYHGVMSMFRNPKLAASVYASQSDCYPVCDITSTMDIGEHPGAYLGEVMAITNADSVRCYKNDRFIKEFYPDTKQYPHMPHPPIIIDDFIGDALVKEEGFRKKSAEQMKELLRMAPKYGVDHLPMKYLLMALRIAIKERLHLQDGFALFNKYMNNWGGEVTTYRFDAIKNGEVVKSVYRTPVTEVQLHVTVDGNDLLEEETYDVASVRVKAIDQHGNQLPYYQEAITIDVEGPIELIGPSHISLKGGAFGFYVRTKGQEGNATVRLHADGVPTVMIPFHVQIKRLEER
ncbi:glycoside hydrolase family 2 protein [Anaerosporobacter faecicola]|uniref:glycoside hydrolase family 2 protein n=1 Tax=Anaerosporobacter faecicola TaxID=2718714 RepID=UPI0014397A50|nr:glycoside hydrolase family 2 protein [Anaerosporobacter faecicola]